MWVDVEALCTGVNEFSKGGEDGRGRGRENLDGVGWDDDSMAWMVLIEADVRVMEGSRYG
jgi:hypothetical protein